MATIYYSAELKIDEMSESESLKALREDIEEDDGMRVTELPMDGMIYECEGNCKRIPRYVYVDGEWYTVTRNEPFKRK